MSQPPLRILIADDHFIVRSGLVAQIDSEPDLKVIAQAADGDQAVEFYARHLPDVAIIDIRMPIRSGPQAIEAIRAQFPDARIIVLTAYSGDEDIHRAMAAGARGYLLKSSTGDELIPSIRTVAAGGISVPRDVADQLAARNQLEALTNREIEVLREIAKGRASKEIASQLSIAENTVNYHTKNILAKLHVSARTEAVTAAIRRGIIEL